jgi:ribosomal protein L7/L12
MSFPEKSTPLDIRSAAQTEHAIRGTTDHGCQRLFSTKANGTAKSSARSDQALLKKQESNISLPRDVAAALQQGNEFEAIRLLREQTDSSLKEAKEAIEAHLERGQGSKKSAPGAVSSSKLTDWWPLALIVATAAAYCLLR